MKKFHVHKIVFEKYDLKTGKDLTMLDIKMDVLQLADVIENFVESSRRESNSNPWYSYSLPGYTWRAGLKITNIKLDYIKDTAKLASGKELILLLDKKIRGGISSVMGDRHVESGENTKPLYIDANYLYGWAMDQYLPSGDFEKLPFETNNYTYDYNLEQLVENLLQIQDNNTYGFFTECDLEHPVETENFPLCPYQTKADTNLFPDYMNSVKQPN